MSQATVWAHDSLCWALLTSCALLIWNVPKKNLCVLRIKFNHSSRSLASSRPNQNPFAWTGHRMCRQNSYTANWVLLAGLRHVYKKFRHFSFASPLLLTWLRLTQSMVKPDWLQIQQTVLLSSNLIITKMVIHHPIKILIFIIGLELLVQELIRWPRGQLTSCFSCK